MLVKRVIFIALLVWIPDAIAHNEILYRDFNLYHDVINGRRSFESLSEKEKHIVTYIYREVTMCSQKHGVCLEVCDAAQELKDAGRNLQECADNHNYSDECDDEYRDVKDAFNRYENAVVDSDGKCD